MADKVRHVRIRDDAILWQDFRPIRWRDDGEVFVATQHTETRWKLVAYGYGLLGAVGGCGYGNGAIYANGCDLIDAPNAQINGSTVESDG